MPQRKLRSFLRVLGVAPLLFQHLAPPVDAQPLVLEEETIASDAEPYGRFALSPEASSETPAASGKLSPVRIDCLTGIRRFVAGGQLVQVDCLIASEVDQVIAGVELDMPCSLSGLPGSTGSAENEAIDFFFGHPNPRRLFSPFTAFFATEPLCCRGAIATFQDDAPTLPADESRYLFTFTYLLSPDATGQFEIIVEGPNSQDPLGPQSFAVGAVACANDADCESIGLGSCLTFGFCQLNPPIPIAVTPGTLPARLAPGMPGDSP